MDDDNLDFLHLGLVAGMHTCSDDSGELVRNYPAERRAVDEAVSDFDGSAVLVTRFVDGHASRRHQSGRRAVRHDG